MAMKRAQGRFTGLVAAGALACLAALAPATARAWWNEEWKGRKQLTIDTSASGASITAPIGATVLLVRLHVGNFKFDAAKEDGSDLRFVAGDDKTPLKHHLEKWDPLIGEALVWVGLPEVKPGARTDLWLYFGNPKATAAEDAKGTFDAGTALAYHFDDRGQAPRDASSWANHAAGAAAPSAEGALIGRGVRLDGATAITIPAGPSLTWSAGSRATFSAWVRPAEANQTATLLSREDAGSRLTVGLEGGKAFVEVVVVGPAGPRRVSVPPAFDAGTWHHLAVVAGDDIGLFVDGLQVATLGTSLPPLAGPVLLGGPGAPAEVAPTGKGKAAAAAPPGGFKGDLDEVQFGKIDRPPGWIRFAALSQGSDPGKLLVAGREEESGSWGDTGYFGILIKAVTPDGWVVIGLLAVMSLVSWLVMVGKAQYLGRVERGDRAFAAWFREASGELARAVEAARAPEAAAELEKAFKHAPVYRIFLAGAGEIRKRTDGSEPLHAEAIEAIRASMDAALVLENQRLNRFIVLLTIAISGGPFLGLLGTVVGVMITFASIAAAGDVNVNAIAPGIAAALVATVAGLAVAIPALFGYNWLLTRIKNASAVLHVFVDELVTKMAEAYSERFILEHRARGPHRAARSAVE
jgi:biopolymer transport protein ExbB